MPTFAAIDVGSNEIRMTVREVDDPWKVKAMENIRMPVRLGHDVFTGKLLDVEWSSPRRSH